MSSLSSTVERVSHSESEHILSVNTKDHAGYANARQKINIRKVNLDKKWLTKNRIVLGENDSAHSQKYKMLRTQVAQKMMLNNWRSIGVVSPGDGEGKTTTCINLAISLSKEHSQKVTLVDMNLRKPAIKKYLGLDTDHDIAECVFNKLNVQDALVSPLEDLFILSASQPVSNSSDLIAAPAMGRVVDQLNNDIAATSIIYDLPSALQFDDALVFSKYIDAFIIVVNEGKTSKDELAALVRLLDGKNILGTVLNSVR